MAERFDTLVEGLSEEFALSILLEKTSLVERPSDRYFAATRLGMSDTEESLNALIQATKLDTQELYDRITRRKAIEALGRRKSLKSIPCLYNVLACSDSEAVINALYSIIRIGQNPSEDEQKKILDVIGGEVTQTRAVIQAHTRLRIGSSTAKDIISPLCTHESALVSGAARAYMARVFGEKSLLKPLMSQLTDSVAGKRRSAVIDLGDAESEDALEPILRAPVSMSLRAKSVFQIIDSDENKSNNQRFDPLIQKLLMDHPLGLDYRPEWQCPQNAEQIEKNLSHRDEAKQYGAAASLMMIDKDECLEIISSMEERLWSDYVTHYYLTMIVGLRSFREKSYLVRSALAETTPQYAKSRVAAAWACLSLDLDDQLELLYDLSQQSPWIPLRWSCQHAFAEMVDRSQRNLIECDVA